MSRSGVQDVLPNGVRRSLTKLGADLRIARKKRGLTVAMMAERTGTSNATYLRIEKGDPSVSLGGYAMALFVLGFGEPLSELVDPSRDQDGLLLDNRRLPQRVRVKKEPTAS